MKSTLLVMAMIAAVSVMPEAWAHRYLENDGTHTTPENALAIGDIGVSQVVYHTVTEDSSQVWLRFEAEAGTEASIQIGVPYIERYAAYRPAFVLLGPGLPHLDAPPVTVPEGYGGIVYTTDNVMAPEIFDEEFTGTKSWVFDWQTFTLPEDGTYYIVAFVPSEEPGKLWIAPGKLESFGLMDILTLPRVIYKVRTFHEVFFWGGILGWGYLVVVLILLAILIGVF